MAITLTPSKVSPKIVLLPKLGKCHLGLRGGRKGALQPSWPSSARVGLCLESCGGGEIASDLPQRPATHLRMPPLQPWAERLILSKAYLFYLTHLETFFFKCARLVLRRLEMF